MVSPELIWLAGALAVMGIALLRMSWGRPGRAAGLNALGWAALAIGVVIGGPLALVVSVLFALAARLALIAAGAGEANGNVAVLGLVPLVWPILAFVLLITQTRGKQLLLTSAVAIAALALAVLVGGF